MEPLNSLGDLQIELTLIDALHWEAERLLESEPVQAGFK